MSRKVHKFKLGPDHREAGQTDFEYTHTAVCDYVRTNITHSDEDVTCKLCLRVMEKEREVLINGNFSDSQGCY